MSQAPDRSPDLHSLDRGWFYHRGGKEHGPLPRESLAETLRLLPSIEVLVWHPSLPDWVSPVEAQARARIYGAGPVSGQPSGLMSLFFSFEGRLGRAKFFWVYCLSITPYVLIVMTVLAYRHLSLTSETGTLIRLAVAPPFVWIGLALTAKRLHDLDLSGIHLLWVVPLTFASAFLPPGPISLASIVLNCVVEIWLLTKRGTYGLNNYGPDPLPIERGYVVGKKTNQGGILNFWTLVSVLILVSAGALLAYGGRVFVSLRPSQSLCSDPGVLSTLHDLVGKDPSLIIIGAYYGSFSNIRISFHSVRTSDAENPVRGSTCIAMMHVAAIDKSKAGIGDQDLSDMEYTVQYIDGSSTQYVVNVVR